MIIEDYTADVFPSLNKDMQNSIYWSWRISPIYPDISQLEPAKTSPSRMGKNNHRSPHQSIYWGLSQNEMPSNRSIINIPKKENANLLYIAVCIFWPIPTWQVNSHASKTKHGLCLWCLCGFVLKLAPKSMIMVYPWSVPNSKWS